MKGLSSYSALHYVKMLDNIFSTHKSYLPEFTLSDVKGNAYDEGGDWPIFVVTQSAGNDVTVVATLHDYHTGEPLYSCNTPCDLLGYRNRKYRVSTFKLGYLPMVTTVPENYDYDLYRDVGSNYSNVLRQRELCLDEFQNRLSEDREAELCSQINLPLPSNQYESGRCLVEYDVNVKGRAKNIIVSNCKDSFFKARLENYIRWHLYYPAIERGVAVETTGYSETYEYSLTSFPYRID